MLVFGLESLNFKKLQLKSNFLVYCLRIFTIKHFRLMHPKRPDHVVSQCLLYCQPLSLALINTLACYKIFISARVCHVYCTWSLYNKTLQTNVPKEDRSCSKLVPSLLSATFTSMDKHTSLLQDFFSARVCNVLLYWVSVQ